VKELPRSPEHQTTEVGSAARPPHSRESARAADAHRLPASSHGWWAAAPLACIAAGLLVSTAEEPWLRLRVGAHAVLEVSALAWWSSAKVELWCCIAVPLWLLLGSILARVRRQHVEGRSSTRILCFVRARPSVPLCAGLLLCAVGNVAAVAVSAALTYPYLSSGTDNLGLAALQIQSIFSLSLGCAYLLDMVALDAGPQCLTQRAIHGRSVVTACHALDCSRLLITTAKVKQVLYLPGYAGNARGSLGAQAVAQVFAGLLPLASEVTGAAPLQPGALLRAGAVRLRMPASPWAWCFAGLLGGVVTVLGYHFPEAAGIGSSAQRSGSGLAFCILGGWLIFCTVGHSLARRSRGSSRVDERVRLLMFADVARRSAPPGVFSGYWWALFLWVSTLILILLILLARLFPWEGSVFLTLVILLPAGLTTIFIGAPQSGILLLGAARFALDVRLVTVDPSGVWLGVGRRRARVMGCESREASLVLHTASHPTWFRIPSLRNDPAAAAQHARELAAYLSCRLPARDSAQSTAPLPRADTEET